MEMHVTHRHPSYQDMTEAAKYKNGIVVLAFLFEVIEVFEWNISDFDLFLHIFLQS